MIIRLFTVLQSCLKTREMPFQRPEISKFHGGACPRTPLGARAYAALRLAPSALDHSTPATLPSKILDPPLHYTEREGNSKRKEIDGPSLQVFPFAFSLSLNLVFPEEFIKYLIAFMIILSDVTRSIHLIVPLFFHFFPPVPNESAVALQSQ